MKISNSLPPPSVMRMLSETLDAVLDCKFVLVVYDPTDIKRSETTSDAAVTVAACSNDPDGNRPQAVVSAWADCSEIPPRWTN